VSPAPAICPTLSLAVFSPLIRAFVGDPPIFIRRYGLFLIRTTCSHSWLHCQWRFPAVPPRSVSQFPKSDPFCPVFFLSSLPPFFCTHSFILFPLFFYATLGQYVAPSTTKAGPLFRSVAKTPSPSLPIRVQFRVPPWLLPILVRFSLFFYLTGNNLRSSFSQRRGCFFFLPPRPHILFPPVFFRPARPGDLVSSSQTPVLCL